MYTFQIQSHTTVHLNCFLCAFFGQFSAWYNMSLDFWCLGFYQTFSRQLPNCGQHRLSFLHYMETKFKSICDVDGIIRGVTNHYAITNVSDYSRWSKWSVLWLFGCITPIFEPQITRCTNHNNWYPGIVGNTSISINVTWLKYCQYGVKLYPINQSINQSIHYRSLSDEGNIKHSQKISWFYVCHIRSPWSPYRTTLLWVSSWEHMLTKRSLLAVEQIPFGYPGERSRNVVASIPLYLYILVFFHRKVNRIFFYCKDITVT